MNQDSTIHDVSDTSFWVAHYRAMETMRSDALFQDPYAEKLVGERGKRIAESMGKISRYTQWSVVSRTVIIDRFIERAIKEEVDAVINLGAGLDARPYRMNLPRDLEWVEADYENIISHKNEILKLESPRCSLTRVAVDLANGEKRRAFLSSAAPNAKKVLVLTEGVIPYLSPEQVSDLASDLLAQKRISFWVTEYFHPRVYPYLKNAVRTLKMKNAPFLFYPEDWFGFFKKTGWAEKETRYNGEIAVEFKRRPPMPFWAKIVMLFMPKRVREQAMRTNGYVMFKRE